jgi:hypothetical protein
MCLNQCISLKLDLLHRFSSIPAKYVSLKFTISRNDEVRVKFQSKLTGVEGIGVQVKQTLCSLKTQITKLPLTPIVQLK